jgi:RNA polymerase sigma-B factor
MKAQLMGTPAGHTVTGLPDTAGLPEVEEPTRVSPSDARALSKEFFARLAVLEEGTHDYQYVRNTLIELNISLVKFAAARFRTRSESMEDIVQVGTIGLIKAIDRFELSREVEFPTFAVPYIVGEIKRFFRDTSWAVRVPRRLQELRLELAKARDVLSQELDRPPTVAEYADRLGLTEEEVLEGLVAANSYSASSLDAQIDEDESTSPLADRLGEPDPAMELVEDFNSLAPLLTQLDERERLILMLRFGQEMTQAQIGEELGISQMHVSRLLARTLKRLRTGLLSE